MRVRAGASTWQDTMDVWHAAPLPCSSTYSAVISSVTQMRNLLLHNAGSLQIERNLSPRHLGSLRMASQLLSPRRRLGGIDWSTTGTLFPNNWGTQDQRSEYGVNYSLKRYVRSEERIDLRQDCKLGGVPWRNKLPSQHYRGHFSNHQIILDLYNNRLRRGWG